MIARVEWLNDKHPVLVFEDDVRVDVYRSTIDNAVVVQIETSPESNSWEDLRVYLNDGEAQKWA